MTISYAELVMNAMSYAAGFTGLPIPDTPPIIQYETREWFNTHVCPKDPGHCVANGWHDHGIIYLLESLPDDELMRRAVHEAAHYLAWVEMGRGPLTCEENAQLEGMAYRAEVLFTVQIQHKPWRRNGVLAKGCGP